MVRVHRIPFSTNVERVALAAAHKGIEVEWIDHDPGDRSALRALSGQPLVPVLEWDGGVLSDSMSIVEQLERLRPARPLYPVEPSAGALVEIFVQWFNGVWKGPPNAIAAEEAGSDPDRELVRRLGERMRGWLPIFDDLLARSDFLLGDAFGAADVCAFPFLKYAARAPHPADPDRFHRVLHEHLATGDGFRRLEAWIERVDVRPRA